MARDRLTTRIDAVASKVRADPGPFGEGFRQAEAEARAGTSDHGWQICQLCGMYPARSGGRCVCCMSSEEYNEGMVLGSMVAVFLVLFALAVVVAVLIVVL